MTNLEHPEFPTETPNRWLGNPRTRLWLYGIAVAVGAALIITGLVTEPQVDAVLSIISAVLLVGVGGLAGANVPK